MASLSLKHIYKVYDNIVKAVKDLNLNIKDKEFVVFVGPSGCGKSTTLRMIAGLEEISSGELRIDNKVVNNVEPKDRDIAMVFQNYALYPHMSVYENMAFGLKIKKLPNEEIHKRIIEAAEVLGITEYLDRKPKAMSGGQRQRVALGRAIVRNPKVFLLDEPLSNLDAKLRTQMRAEILKLYKKLDTTFVYVTHDQVEAMTMGTKIVVMKDGILQQVDTPKNLYKYPNNKFVASFIGTPQMNFLNATLLHKKNEIIVKLIDHNVEFNIPYNSVKKIDKKYLDGNLKVVIGIRSEHLKISYRQSCSSLKLKISHIEDLGDEMLVYAIFEEEDSNTKPNFIIIKSYNDFDLNVNDIIYVDIEYNHMHFFDFETEQSINSLIPSNNVIKCRIKNNMININNYNFPLPSVFNHIYNGEYLINIPTDAFINDDKIETNIDNIEKINNNQLLTLNLNNNILFAILEGKYKKNDKLYVGLDFKKITLLDNFHNEIVKPLNIINKLDMKFIKQNDKKEVSLKLLLHNSFFDCPENISNKILSSLSTKAFKTTYQVNFTAYDYEIVNNGIEGKVTEILDYGNEVFIKVSYDDGVYILFNRHNNKVGDTIGFKPIFSKVEIVEKSKQITII